MKKHLIIEAIMALMIVGLSLYSFTVHLESTNQENKEETTIDTKETQKEIDDLKIKVGRLSKENTTLENQLTVEKNNNETIKGENTAFETTIREAFKALYNFDPDSMEERKEANRPYLSENLFKQYFENGSTYGDSNGVESELTHLKLYTASVQGNQMDGLVAIESQSRMENTDWKKGRNIYQVTYDTKAKKITTLKNLGSSYASDIYE